MAPPVQCKIVGGRAIPAFQMLPSSRMKELKVMIKAITGIYVGRQTLRFNRGGVELLDSRSLRSYGFEEEALIHLDVSPLTGDPEFEIFLRPSNHKLTTIKVKETDTVADLYGKIKDVWGIPEDKMTLNCLNTPILPFYLNKELHLSDYYICEGAFVDVAANDEWQHLFM